MALIKDRRLVEDDPWVGVADDAPLPENRPAIVGLKRWRAERESLAALNRPLGLLLEPDDPLDDAIRDLGRFDLIALSFPKFGDGRAFSKARLLRSRLGYKGELRAVGDVFKDQLLFMARCGFDSFDLKDGHDAKDALAAFGEFSVAYQPSAAAAGTALRGRGKPPIA